MEEYPIMVIEVDGKKVTVGTKATIKDKKKNPESDDKNKEVKK